MTVLGNGPCALHEPRFSGNEQDYVKNCISSSFVSSIGAYVDRFENELAEFTGARRAIAVVNGTAALQVALYVAGIKNNDEVIVPALTFIATANAVHYLGAIPHFVDCNETTLGIDPLALRERLKSISEPSGDGYINSKTGRRLRAIVPMHTFGHPCNIDELLAIAHDYRLKVVEDAAEGLGSFYKSRHTGTFGLLGALSFNGNKLITTGGGGAILTNNETIARNVKHLTTTAKISHKWMYDHDMIGYNYRMPNINAALGCAQLEQINDFLTSKRKLFSLYHDVFETINDVKLMSEPVQCKSNYWLQTLILSKSMTVHRDVILEKTNDLGLMTRPPWKLLNKLKPYKNCPSAPLPVASSLADRIINIPSSSGLA